MCSGTRVFLHGLNNGFSSEFLVDYLDWHMLNEVWKVQWPKCDKKNSTHLNSESNKFSS